MKKRMITIILSMALALSVSGCLDSEMPELPDDTSQTTTGTQTSATTTITSVSQEQTTSPHTTAAETTEQPPVETVVLLEVPLAGEAVLIVERVKRNSWDYYRVEFSVLYADSDEPICLFEEMYHLDLEVQPVLSDFARFIAVSPGLTRISYCSERFEHRGGIWNVFDVLEQDIVATYYGDWHERVSAITETVWLDDETLLAIEAYRHGSATVGGWVHYYNIADGSSRIIIHGGTEIGRFHVRNLKIDGDNLELKVALYHEGFNFMGDYVYEYVPLSQIRELIASGETLTLEFPNIEDMEHDCVICVSATSGL